VTGFPSASVLGWQSLRMQTDHMAWPSPAAVSALLDPVRMQKSATGVARHRPGERDTIGSVAARALTEDWVEMEFLTDDPVAQAVTYQRVTFDARAPRCGRYVCATAGRVNWT
jgi:hypothetical protein